MPDDSPATVEQLVGAFARALDEAAPELSGEQRAAALEDLRDAFAIAAEHWERLPTMRSIAEALERASEQD
jgi:hypothetical protein